MGPQGVASSIVLVAVFAAACARGTVEEAAVWELREAPEEAATELPITVLGGGCHADVERVSRVEVHETDDQVEITAFIEEPSTPAFASCDSIGVSHAAMAVLQRPLGDRELVDPACREVRQHTACDEPKTTGA